MVTTNIENIGDIRFIHGIDEKAFQFRNQHFSELIPEGSIVLDIGAHVGSFSLVFGSCVGKNGKVLCFEPNPKTFEALKAVSFENTLFNLVPYNFACTPETKEYIFHYSDPNVHNLGMNGGGFDQLKYGDTIKKYHPVPVKVKGINLNNFLQQNYKDQLDKIKFIKTDTEGLDKDVLKTLKNIIVKNRPVLMVEAFKALTQDEIKDFWNVIKSFDYKIYDVSPLDNKTDAVGPLSEEEFEHYIYKIVDNGNFFCFHKDEIHKYNLPITKKGKTSVIVFSRNDGYKEKERFAIHIKTMLETFDEVVYVDWNSETHSLLYDVLDLIPKTGRLKHFVIPSYFHELISQQIPNSPDIFVAWAFNIAIRRTDAEWIVLSTMDIIPPTKSNFENFLQTASKNTMYSFSRRDVEYDDIINNINDLTNYREFLDKSTSPRYFPAKVSQNDNYSIFNCCGDFQLASKNLWFKIRGYEEEMVYACFLDTNAQKKAVLYGFDLVPVYDVPLYHMSHKNILPQGGNTENLHKVAKTSNPTYNDVLEWVEYFDKYQMHDHIMFSRNLETWGFLDTEIEYEVF